MTESEYHWPAAPQSPPSPRWPALWRVVLVALTVVPMARVAGQGTLYWDANGATDGSGNIGGNWGAELNWSSDPDGASATVGWTDGNHAIFSAGSDGIGAWTVNIGGTVAPESITFAQDGSKTISGG
jgi:fibronectin-binding autotransporter adhesin